MDVIYTTGIFLFGVIPHFTNDTKTIIYAAAQYVVCDTLAASYVFNATTHTSEPAPLVGGNSYTAPKALTDHTLVPAATTPVLLGPF